jgi:hypothetical protein
MLRRRAKHVRPDAPRQSALNSGWHGQAVSDRTPLYLETSLPVSAARGQPSITYAIVAFFNSPICAA